MRLSVILRVIGILILVSSISLLLTSLLLSIKLSNDNRAPDGNKCQTQAEGELLREKNAIAPNCDCSKENMDQEEVLQLDDSIEKAVLNKLVKISENLAAAHRMLRGGEAANRVQSSYHLLQEVIHKINPKLTTPSTEKDAAQTKVVDTKAADVCPEVYKNSLYGYPFFYEGFVETNCTNAKPLHDVVSILLNFVDYPKDIQVSTNTILEGIEKSYRNISVIVAKENDLDLPKMKSIKVETKVYSKTTSAGQIWNELIKAAKTKYVLIGRDITYFDWNSRLTRLIREVGYLNIPAAGGAIRTPDGHWSLSCHQVAYKNYTIAYRAGYDISQHECIYCGHITGPFVSRTSDLLKILFDQNLSSDVVFEDFFMRLHKRNILSAVCPDTLYYVLDRSNNLSKKETWIPIAQQWDLNQIHLANGQMHIFTKKDYNGGCQKQNGLAVAPRCLQNLANGIKFLMKTCEENNIYCELQEGSLLGAVKFNKVLPWERDADITFLSGNYSALQKLSNVFQKGGYYLHDLGAVWCCADNRQAGGKFTLGVGSWNVELYGQHLMDSEILANKAMSPTKVYFDGMWVNTPTNPALYARNRYGHEIFKHAQHWMTTGHSSGWELYKPSKFSSCPKTGAHNCLDQYIADGNLQFEVPIP